MTLESEYEHCIPMTIPPSAVSEPLADFPLMIKIGRSAGKYRDDISDVFVKIGASYQKLAISLEDNTTQLPAEVTGWDVRRQLGILFVKIPSVPTAGMTLKLWYDPTHADNTTNVGAIGSAAGQSVWANGFEGVWHMKPSGGLVLDSTANANHGTIYGATLTTGPLGTCLAFDGVDDVVRCGNITVDSAAVTIDLLFIPDITYDGDLPDAWYGGIGTYRVSAYGDSAGCYMGWASWGQGAWLFGTPTSINPDNRIGQEGSFPMAAESLSYITGVKSGQNIGIYNNGVIDGTGALPSPATIATATDFRIAGGSGGYLNGKIPYVALSSVARSPAWIALTNASLKDELITFSTPGTESLTGNERMRLMPDGTLIADEFVEV